MCVNDKLSNPIISLCNNLGDGKKTQIEITTDGRFINI
jgi:hypothetical protein